MSADVFSLSAGPVSGGGRQRAEERMGRGRAESEALAELEAGGSAEFEDPP